MTFRFRYYRDENDHDPFSGKDKKNWYSATSDKMTREEFLAQLRQIIGTMEAATGNECDEILMVNGDYKRFYDEFSKKPWAHMKLAH